MKKYNTVLFLLSCLLGHWKWMHHSSSCLHFFWWQTCENVQTGPPSILLKTPSGKGGHSDICAHPNTCWCLSLSQHLNAWVFSFRLVKILSYPGHDTLKTNLKRRSLTCVSFLGGISPLSQGLQVCIRNTHSCRALEIGSATGGIHQIRWHLLFLGWCSSMMSVQLLCLVRGFSFPFLSNCLSSLDQRCIAYCPQKRTLWMTT